MAGLKHSNPHLSKFPGIFLGILLGLGWQNLPQRNFFPFWSLWDHLQLGAQSQKHLLHIYFPYLIMTASANATRGFPCPFQGDRRGQSSGSSTFSPSQPKLVVTGWLLENLSENFLPWDWSSCYKTHYNSSADKQLSLGPHSAEHLHFLAILLANLQALPVQSIVSCLISLLYLLWKPLLICSNVTWTG